ncbi:MAG: ABC transporter ATP-binding protein [Clostridia bacterium]|nr:ABC transporter ATP-binding protein [Clostridia bacterium]
MQTKQRPLRAMLRLLRPNAGRFAVAGLATVITVFLGYATPMLLAETVDCILSDRASTLPGAFLDFLRGAGMTRGWITDHLWFLAIVLVLLHLLNGAASYVRGRLSAKASEGLARDLRVRLYDHLQRLPFAYHVHAETGDLIQRCTSDVDTVRRFLSMQVLEIFNALLMITVALVILLGRNVKLTLISVALTPAIFWFAAWFFRRVRKSFKDADESEGRMSAVLQENLSGVRVVRAFGQQEREVEKFDAVSEDYRRKAYRVNNLLAIYWGGGDAITMTQQMITLLVCVVLAAKGEISVGMLILFTSYVGQLLWPIRQLGRTLSDTGKSMVAMERIQTILDTEPEPEEPGALRPDLHGDIVFDHVSFAYPDDGVPVLEDVSFTIKAGTTAAVLGSTGSGKSTMMYLLQRLYEPTGGRITIGGVDLKDIDRTWLRSQVGLILQEPFLYSRTIRENVGIARRNPQEADITHAADVAAASGFIARAEKGYDTVVGERGVTLSGGQKQRIAIARTLLKDNAILVFDDSLSAVDTETDARIRAALQHEQARTTTLIISHRLTTLSQADLILVLENGRITDRGTHAELAARPGLYQRIYAIQTGLEEEFLQTRDEEVK